MNRRQFMQALMAGAVVTAEGLWMPGAKTISIPSGKVFTGQEYIVISGPNQEYHIGVDADGMTLAELYQKVRYITRSEKVMFPSPADVSSIYNLADNHTITGLEHVRGGTLHERHTDTIYQSSAVLVKHVAEGWR